MSAKTVARWRKGLGLGRDSNPDTRLRWVPEERALLGRAADAEVAAQIGRTKQAVALQRWKLDIA